MLSILNPLLGRGEARVHRLLIKDCVKNHTSCRSHHVPSFLPSRLIDVRSYPAVRLFLKSELPREVSAEDCEYIALSYCWGTSMPEEGKTTTRTLEARRRGIDVEKLPLTLKDAMKLAHALGVPFLWIDALCILQDDEEDWNYESTLMGRVYSQALVTIAAASSDDCSGGFLRASYAKKDLPVPRRGGYGLEYDLKTHRLEPNPWQASFEANPLLGRGWTLQERELSPRVLHFARMHVIWECRERVYAYVRPLRPWATPKLQAAELDHFSVVWQYRCFDIRSDDQRAAGSSPRWYLRTWRRMVANYSGRRFTKTSDKLPAIAGLADAVQEVVKSDYLAGLWRDSILDDLLWHRAGHRATTIDRPSYVDFDGYYAPSWSWARTDFEISFPYSAGDDFAEVLEAETLPEGAKQRLTGGHIRLRTKVFEMASSKIRASSCKYDTMTHGDVDGDRTTVVCVLKTAQHVEGYWGGRENQTFFEGYYGGGFGLILQRMESSPTFYERIGVVEHLPFESFEDLDYQEITIV